MAMTTPYSSAQLIVEMRSLARDLFTVGVDALSATGSSAVDFHPRTAQLMCLDAVRYAAFRRCRTVLAPSSKALDDVTISAAELLKLAENAACIQGSIAIVTGRTKRGPCNKRLALSFALAAERSPLHRPWTFLSGTTRHRQCRYRSAGAIVDAGTCSWIWPCGNHTAALPADPTTLLAASGDLLLMDAPASQAMDIDLIILA
jgi:hypothetical protein